MKLRFLHSVLALFLSFACFAQVKIGVTITNPADVHLCNTSDYIEIEVRNISASTVTSIETQVVMPTGMTYVASSISSSNVTEKNITDLTKPTFSIPNLPITQAATFKIKVNTQCAMSNFLNNGGLAVLKTTTLYSGGTVTKNSAPLNIKQPSLQIASITNQLKTADLGEIYIRQITVKNNGTGKLSGFVFERNYQNGQALLGTTGGVITQSGTKTTSTVSSSHLTAVGNNDGFLDLNETFVFRDSILVQACSNLKADYEAKWGCNSQYCSNIKSSGNTTITAKNPNLEFTVTASSSACLGSNFQHEQELVIFNKGNDTARAIDLNIFQSANLAYYAASLSQIIVNSITYQTTASGTAYSLTPYKTSATANTGVFSCLGNNPKGEVFLNLPDIAPNKYVIVKWKTKSCCPTNCATGSYYNQRWSYNVKYQNQCGNTIAPGSQWGSYGGYQSMIISKFTPSDISDGQKKQWEYSLSNGYLMYASAKSQLQVQLILPSALSHSLTTADLKFEHANGTSWTPNRFTQNGDTVTAYFNGSPTVTLPRSELLINMEANCSGNTSNSTKTYQVNISYLTDTTCSSGCPIPIYCDADQIKIHCSTGCNAGLHFNGFEAKRVSIGLPDNDNDGIPDASGSIDYSRIKTNRIMYGDTLLTTFNARVHNAGSITNWYYGKATSTLDYGKYLSVESANLRIFRSGNLIASCNSVPYSLTTSGNAKTYVFDVSINSLIASGCGIYNAFYYIGVDSLVLDVMYVVDDNIGNQNVDLTINNDFYLSSVANPSTSQKFQCDSFSARLSLIGWYFTNYGRNNLTISGCDAFNVTQSFYLSIGQCCSNYAGGNIFPFEYRKWARLSEVFVLKEPSYDIQSANILQYRTKGTGGLATQSVPSISPYFTSPGEYRYRTDSLYSNLGGNWLTSDDGFQGVFNATLTPNCQARNGASLIKYAFVFEKIDGLGTGLDTLYSVATSDQIIYEKPNLQLTVTNPYVYPEQDTVEWNVRVTNASTVANAFNVWLGSLANNNTEIVSIYDVASGTNLTKTNDIHKLGKLNPLQYKDIIVKATYISCSPDSVRLLLGYDCQEYPNSISTAYCNTINEKLYFEPINTRLEASIIGTIDDVDLCAENEYNVLIRNTGSPKVYDTYLDIILRNGMELGDSAWLYVDGRNDSIFIGTAINMGSNTYRWELSAKDSSLLNNGMNGVKSTTGYLMTLKFTLKTDCDFTSATSFLLRPGGRLKCGTAVNAPFTLGDPINIKGVVRPYFSALDFQINHIDACNYVDSTFAKFLNLGPDTTRISDSIVLTVPPGLVIDISYIDNTHNSPIDGAKFSSKNGSDIYKWGIPEGIIPGDSCIFIIKTGIDNSQLTCGIKQIYVEAVSSQEALCVETNTYCSISVATSSLLITDSVEKGQFDVEFNSAVSTPNGNLEDISLSYDVTNNGADLNTGSLLECSIYFDKNANGTVDAADSLVAIDSILNAILTGNSLTRNFSFATSSAFTCNLLLHISESNCVCSPTTIPIPPIQLLNAGNDTTICPGDIITIGSIGNDSISYLWNNSALVTKADTSTTTFIGTNTTTAPLQIEMILTTTKATCSTSDTMFVNFYPKMKLNMADTTRMCLGDQTIIGETVLGGSGRVKTYLWYPSDSLERTNKSRTFAYPTTSTTYFVDVSDEAGCSITDSIHIEIIEAPIAAIEVQDTCIFNNVFIKNKTNYLGQTQDSVHWDFEDMGESTFNNAVLFLDSSRILPIHLYVQNTFGCWDTVSTTMEIFPEPTPSIEFSSACENLIDTVWASSSILYGTINHSWVLDGKSYSGDTITYTVPQKDSISIELSAVSDHGCSAKIKQTFEIYDQPEISINSSNVCLNDSTSFIAVQLSGTSDSITSFVWDIANGTPYSTQNCTHLFADTGTFNNTLVVYNAKGCSDTASMDVTVHPLPQSAFTTTDGCLGDTISITSNATLTKGSITSVLWNQGTGFTSGADSFTFIPQTTGNYSIGQKVISDKGCVDSSSQSYNVYYVDKALFTQTGICENKTISFQSNPNAPDSIAQIQWTLLNDTFYTDNFSYKFLNDGTYSLYQKITTNRGCESDSTFSITIRPAPVAQMSVIKPCQDDSVVISSNTPNVVYNWLLSDGTSNTNAQFNKTFAGLGKYSIDLFVANAFGCVDSISDTVNINNIVSPDFEIENLCVNETQWVIHTTTGNVAAVTQALFDMGNGDQINALDSFQYAYLNSGSYKVTLAITTLPGCNYSTEKTVIVYPLPQAGFRLFPETADIFTSTIQGTDESQRADSIVYTMSDGSVYISRDFEHTFLDSGSYTIQQWVSSQFGCFDSITRDLYITFAYNLYIPNAFSPDGNSINDVFKPVGLGLRNYEMSIYNRWGEKLFESNEKYPAWDGKDAMAGYYMYQIRAYDFQNHVHVYSGVVYLVR